MSHHQACYVEKVAITTLAFIAAGAPVGMTALTVAGHQIPNGLETIGAAATGAMVTLLVTTRSGRKNGETGNDP